MTSTASKLYRALFIGMGLLLVSASSSHADGNLSAAQEMFAEHRYAAGLAHLRKAAEAGDREARRTLGLMLLYGATLYQAEVPTNREDGLRWLRLAAIDGCETSKHVLAKLGETARRQSGGIGVNSNETSRLLQ